MNKKKRILASVLILVMSIQLCGFMFPKTEVAVDTEKYRVYKYITADVFSEDFAIDDKSAENKYKNNFYLISGQVVNVKNNGDSITISGFDRYAPIECTCPKGTRSNATEYKSGDGIGVYGKFTVDLITKKRSFAVDKLIAPPENIISSETYYTIDGSSCDLAAAYTKTLNNGHAVYRITPKLKSVETKITEDIGTIEGYQYDLNKLSGSSSVEPEVLFVCYFDKGKLKKKGDITKTNLTEKAIVKNIEGSVGFFPTHKADTYYGVKYQYYLGKFTNNMELGKGYHTEYIFQADGDRGIIMYLYLYREPKHLSDVMFVTRFMEIV